MADFIKIFIFTNLKQLNNSFTIPSFGEIKGCLLSMDLKGKKKGRRKRRKKEEERGGM